LSSQLDDQPEPSIAELIEQLVEDARDFARAEANLYKAIALYRLSQARVGLIALGAGALLLLAALISLLVMLAIGLTLYLGPIGAGLVVGGAALVAGYLLVRYGLGHLEGLLGDEVEARALREGEEQA
jgi:hypothetical protein